jgi:hypothetical protein
MTEQDGLVHAMAEDLEGIARHFGQVRDAMKVEEDGATIDSEDFKSEYDQPRCKLLILTYM